jgi:hypothetical protein
MILSAGKPFCLRKGLVPGMTKNIKPRAPVSQKQEDLLLELFFQLTTDDRKRIIRLCRDMIKTYDTTHEDRSTGGTP